MLVKAYFISPKVEVMTKPWYHRSPNLSFVNIFYDWLSHFEADQSPTKIKPLCAFLKKYFVYYIREEKLNQLSRSQNSFYDDDDGDGSVFISW